MNLEELSSIQLDCFKCKEAYNCKYYQNPLWDWYMVVYQDGCPAKKFPFDSLYYAVLKEKEKNGKRSWR